jgi:tripartite-type tricarboxylate transporter receptor subunit TctC
MRAKKFWLQLLLFFVSVFVPAHAFSQASFYEGKTITIVLGTSPGGVGDLRLRALGPFLHKYIPGNPTIVIENMPGAGGRKAANHIFAAARPDGLTIGGLLPGTVPDAITGQRGVLYDIDKLIYLGTPNSGVGHSALFTRKEAGLDSIEKLRATPGIRIGAPTVGHPHYVLGRFFAYVIGMAKPTFITGYKGPEIDLALMSGEVDARAHSPDTILLRNPDWIDKGLIDFNVVMNVPRGKKHPHPAFARLPELQTFAKSHRERRLFELYEAFRTTGSPLVLPPGTPKDRVTVLQDSVRKAFKDPEFHKEFRKHTGQDAEPLMPEELAQAIKELPREPEAVDLFKTLAGGEPLPPR